MASFHLLQNFVVTDFVHVMELLDLTRTQQRHFSNVRQQFSGPGWITRAPGFWPTEFLELQRNNLRYMSKGYHLVGGFDANKRLSKGYGSEATVKEEQTDVGVDVEETGHVQIVGQGGREPQDPDHTLGGLHLKISALLPACILSQAQQYVCVCVCVQTLMVNKLKNCLNQRGDLEGDCELCNATAPLIVLTSLKPGENSIYITYQGGREERKLVVGVEVVCTICASCWM